MSISDYIILGISSVIVAYLHSLCYKELSNTKLKINFKTILIFIIFGGLFTVNNYLIEGVTNKIIISIVLLSIMYKFIFRETIKETLIKGMICYSIAVIVELLLSVIAMKLNILTIVAFNSNILLKSIFSFLELIISILIIKIKKINLLLNKVIHSTNKDIIVILFVLASAVTMIILVSQYERSFKYTTYITNIILLLIFTGLMAISVFNNTKAKKESEKIETLLNFMSKYEKIIDEDSINRHEMLNNLLILKSFKNKNTKKFDSTLDDIIELYEKSGRKTIKNVSILPSGLKGVIYYKVEDMNNNKIDVNLNISKDAKPLLNKVKSKDYVSLCKIVGIILDNANEAAKDSHDKKVFIEVYEINGKLVIYEENTFKNEVNLTRIKEQYYSTKGKGRGLGLYLANKLVKNSECIEMNQKILNDKFITEIIVTI